MTCVPSLWKRWIPKGNCLVANACPAKSRIIPNQHRKSKKAKGKWANQRNCPGLPFALFLPSAEPEGEIKTRFSVN
jgi:hypothetical protein